MMKKLRRKFVLITMGLVSLVLLAVLFGICLYYADTLRRESYRSLEMALERPADGKGPQFAIGGPVPEDFGHSPTFIAVTGPDGTTSLQNAESFDVDETQLSDILAQVRQQGQKRGELDDYDLRYLVSDRPGDTRIAFAALAPDRRRILGIFSVTAAAVAGALVIFSIASVLLARWALRPVEQTWQKQRQFVANASHELKTPLTVILANMGIVKSHAEDSVAGQMTWIRNTEEEALRMKGLVDGLLFLAKGDDMAGGGPMLPVDFSDAVSTMALSFEPVAFEKGLNLHTKIEPEIRLSGNEPQLRQLVGILLDNAVKYAKGTGAIELALKKSQSGAELSVYNDGDFLSPEERGRLFDRFYRADPSRSQPGYGLGLSIARMIAENHRGRISADNVKSGVMFTVWLPLK